MSSPTTSSSLVTRPCSPQSPGSPLVTTPPVVMSPCAACRILRRRCCADKCVLAPYFPPTDPMKFSIAHKVFGASNIIKMLQDLPETQRADAVSSMVYEANARVRDPIYGSAGAICQLQRQVSELQAELAKSRAQFVTLQSQHSNLLALFCMQQDVVIPQQLHHSFDDPNNNTTLSFYNDDEYNKLVFDDPVWESLWT
ncbi:hypothetical protein vseg_002854 [Gypsophila vaccaria]